MPHSALVKIQFGGLSGIKRLLGETGGGIDDIDGLLAPADQYGGLQALPCEAVVADITGYRVRRRR